MFKILCFFTLLISFRVSSENQDSINLLIEFKYKILLEDNYKGVMKVKVLHSPNKSYSLLTSSEFSLSGWWGKYLVYTNLIEHFSKTGMLIQVNNMIIDGEEAYWKRLTLIRGQTWESTVKTKNIKKFDEEDFIDTIGDIGDKLIVRERDVLTVSNLLFTGSESSNKSIRLPKKSYDTSFNNIPFYWQRHHNSLPDEINIIDTETESIYKLKIEKINSQENHKFSTDNSHNSSQNNIDSTIDYYVFTPDNGKPIHMWLTINRNNIPYFIKLTGEDEDGTFHIEIMDV